MTDEYVYPKEDIEEGIELFTKLGLEKALKCENPVDELYIIATLGIVRDNPGIEMNELTEKVEELMKQDPAISFMEKLIKAQIGTETIQEMLDTYGVRGVLFMKHMSIYKTVKLAKSHKFQCVECGNTKKFLFHTSVLSTAVVVRCKKCKSFEVEEVEE